jgi:hypothetical protein
MSDEETFLARWSRRKLTPALDAEERVKREKGGGVAPSEASVTSDDVESPLEPEGLPPIESIGSGSDVRAFLAAGVPADLTRAALRRLWVSDPKIRDFVGLSENSWDFNAPGSMAGFGPIDKEQVGRVLTQLLGDSNTEGVPSHSMNMDREIRDPEIGPSESDQQESADSTIAVDQKMPDPASTPNDLTQWLKVAPMSQQASASADQRAPCRRGGALPK